MPQTGTPVKQASPQIKAHASSSQATRLVELATDLEVTVFHTPDQTACASILAGDHYETWQLKVKRFRHWLARQFYEREQTTPNAQAIQDAISVLT